MNRGQLADFFAGKRILVCGGAGFIGSHLVDALVRLESKVTVIDPCFAETGANPGNLELSKQYIEWIAQPIQAVRNLEFELRHFDLVIDSMGLTKHHIGLKNPQLDLAHNYQCHLVLIEALSRQPVPTLYLGSRAQYGKLEGIISEDSPQNPLDPQGVHKAAAEAMFRIYSQRNGWPCMSLRVGNCFGPRQTVIGDDVGLVAGFVRSILADQIVELYGDSTRQRHILYVKDLIEQIISMGATITGSGFQAVNVIGQSVRLTELLDTLIQLTGRGGYRLLPFPESVAQIDPGYAKISQDKLKSLLGIIYCTPLQFSLDETLKYFESIWEK